MLLVQRVGALERARVDTYAEDAHCGEEVEGGGDGEGGGGRGELLDSHIEVYDEALST